MNRSTFGLNETPSYIIRNTINDWDFLDDFLRALRKVDSGYYMYPIKDDNGKTDRKYPERVFAYEFYHQYRKIMEGKRDVYSGLYLNGEQTKERKVANYIGDFTPDLVLHSRLDGMCEGSQKWLCEIKMIGSGNPLSDIEKFSKMEKLNFDEYIFLYAGSCLPNLLLKIQNKIKIGEISRESDGNCICICSYYGKTSKLHIECHRLYTLIDMIKELDMKSLRKQITRIKQTSDSEIISKIVYTE